MKTIVIYKSKSGYTKRYAEWIAAELGADLIEAAQVKLENLTDYGAVIFGGGLYAVGINGVKLITGNLERFKGKKVVVFATGASTARAETINEIRNKNFTPEQLKMIRFYYLRGGFDFSKLRPVDKVVMRLMKRVLSRKKDLTADEQGMLGAFEKPVDFVDRRNIRDLVEYVKG